jgi:hypothetical protein
MTLVDALQEALALEHEAVYGYGLVVARLRGKARRLATEALQRHQQRRDDLAAMVAALHRDPTPAAPAYLPPHPVDDRHTAVSLAGRIEQAAAGAAWDLVAATAAASSGRRLAVSWLRDAATTSAEWDALLGSAPAALPGQPEPSHPSTSSTSSSSSSTTPSGSTS